MTEINFLILPSMIHCILFSSHLTLITLHLIGGVIFNFLFRLPLVLFLELNVAPPFLWLLSLSALSFPLSPAPIILHVLHFYSLDCLDSEPQPFDK